MQKNLLLFVALLCLSFISCEHQKTVIVTDSGNTIRQPASKLDSDTRRAVSWDGAVVPQGRLLAIRAAKLDAYRNLAEYIEGLKINATTSVKDFVLEKDEVKTELDTFIRGITTGEPRYYNDFTVEIDAQVEMTQVVVELKRIAHKCYPSGRWHKETFSTIREYEKKVQLVATGTGVVADKHILKRDF